MVKMLFARRLEGHREQLVLLLLNRRRGRRALGFAPGGGGPAHFVGKVGAWIGAKGLPSASIRSELFAWIALPLHVGLLLWRPWIPVVAVRRVGIIPRMRRASVPVRAQW